MNAPLCIEVTRGNVVESRHRALAVAADAAGGIVAAWGAADAPCFPRSAIKPIQALPLAETGALAAFGLDDEHLALACASHSGEPMHTGRVAAWLARLGLTENDLECGAHAPAGEATSGPWSALHNNCSGKHAGFLSVARHLGLPTRGYVERDHPVQQMVTAAIHDLTGAPEHAPWGIDGCGIPTYALPLAALAAGMARLADPATLPPGRAAAARAIVAAMRAHPELVAGTGRMCSEFMRRVPDVAIKGGAEGVYTAIIPARGWGIAVKVEDGAKRASEVAVLHVLKAMGLLGGDMEDWLRPVIHNVAGKAVGDVRVAD